MDLAEFVSRWSKDPSTKVGAVIVADDNRILSLGFNGFARGVCDSNRRLEIRELKYDLILHAEENAIINARGNVAGATLFNTASPCSLCVSRAVQAGIKTMVIPRLSKDPFSSRSDWEERLIQSEEVAHETGLKIIRWNEERGVPVDAVLGKDASGIS
jgi:dCMP deaminase